MSAEKDCGPRYTEKWTVSDVQTEGALPITDVWATTSPAVYHDPTSPVNEWWWYHAVPDGWNIPIALPPNAKPGMWATREVSPDPSRTENVDSP